MQIFRKILFYIFVLIYMFVCPLIVLNALGIIFFPNQQKTIQSTGLISLATIPEGASVFINGSLYKRKSPTIVRRLPAGEYALKISLDQYNSADKTVHIDKGQAIALDNIILIPNKWPKDILSSLTFDQAFSAYNNPYTLLVNNPLLSGVYVFKRDDSLFSNLESGIKNPKKEIIPLFPEDGKYADMQFVGSLLMPKSPFALIKAKKDEKFFYLWIDLRSPGSPILDISHLFLGSPDKIFWNYDDNENIFYFSGSGLNRINLKENAVYPDIAENIKSVGILNKKLLVVNFSSQFEEIDYKGNTKKTLMGQWPQMPDVFKQAVTLQMMILSDKIVLFIDEHGRLLSTTLPYDLIDDEVEGIGDVLDDNRVLVWTRTQLGYIDFKEIKHEGIFEAGPRVEWVVKNAKDIQQAFWANDGSHILFRDKQQVKLAEVGSYADRGVFNVEYSEGEIAYSDTLGKVFFIDKDTRKFVSLTVISQHGFIKFVLPDSIEKMKE